MTRQQIYTTSTQLQYHIREAIHACHVQNHDRVVRILTTVINVLAQMLETVFTDLSYYNQEIELVSMEGINLSLQDILCAQEHKDYVLLADLLELRLVPFLQSLQEAIRSYDGVDTDPEIWKNNMLALKKRDVSLWNQLKVYHERYEKETAAGTWQMSHHLETANTGAFTLVGQDGNGSYYYHSNISPEEEAADFAGYYYTMECPSYVVWGLGLGYHIHELFRLDDGIRIQVFENDLDVIYHCLMAVDSSIILNDLDFELIYDPDFKKVISVLDEESQNFIIHNPSMRHIKDAGIREQMEMFFIRDSGKRNAAILFENNSRENMKLYDDYADSLQSEFSGKHAVIVAAGPSLDKNVELLKNKTPDMVILAVETVFRKLLNLGIDVDYVIVTDANSRVYWHLEGLEDRQIPMLYLSTAYKGYAMRYKGKKYLICQSGYKKAEDLAGQNGWHLYETGGSVTTTALDLCIHLGCKSIAFIGLDLAYTDNLAHAEGTARRKADEAGEMKQVPALGGGTVPASKVFIMYNRWIAQRVMKRDVVMPVIDATEGGAVIPGLQTMTFEKYLEEMVSV